MNIVMTGHTRGLGKVLYDHMTSLGWAVTGFSRNNEGDINSPPIRDHIAEVASNADVVINNAWSNENPWSQIDLQKLLIKKHRGNTSHVLIGTRATDWGLSSTYPHYEGSKDALHRIGRWATVNTSIRTLVVRPGLLDVEKFRESTKPKVDPIDVAQTITNWINLPQHPYMNAISEVVFSPRMEKS